MSAPTVRHGNRKIKLMANTPSLFDLAPRFDGRTLDPALDGDRLGGYGVDHRRRVGSPGTWQYRVLVSAEGAA